MMNYSRFAPQWCILFFCMAALVQLAQAQQTAVRSNVIGDKVYLEIDLDGLQANLDSLFAQSAASSSALGSLTWADLLDQGTSPGMDVSFFGYDLTGLGQVTSSATLTADSLVLNKDAQIVGRLSLGGVATLSDSLKVQGVVEFADSLRVVKSVSIGERLFVSGITTMGDSLHVVGNVDLAALFNVAGAATFGSTVDVSGVATFGDSLVVEGVAVLQDSLSVAGNAHLRQDLQVDGHLNLGGDLTVNGESTFNDTAHFAAPALFGDSASFAGNVNMAGGLSVTSLTINGVDIPAMDDTDELPEGSSNLYFTNSRAQGAFTAGTGVSLTSGTIAIGQPVATTDDVTFDELAADSVSASGSLEVSGKATFSDSLLVASGANFSATLVADSLVSAGLSLSGGLRIQDGNQAAGKVLTSDLAGNATWQTATSPYTAGTGVDVTSNVISIGQAVGTTNDVTFADLNVDSARTTAFRLQNGTQGTDYVLSSDANGNARWKELGAAKSPVFGVMNPSAPIQPINSASYCTGSYIDIPPGSWAVNVGLVMTTGTLHAGGYWVRTMLSTDCATNTPPTYVTGGPMMVAGMLSSHSPYGFLTGVVMVENTGTSAQRLYIWREYCDVWSGADGNLTLANFARGVYGEDYLYAMPMNN